MRLRELVVDEYGQDEGERGREGEREREREGEGRGERGKERVYLYRLNCLIVIFSKLLSTNITTKSLLSVSFAVVSLDTFLLESYISPSYVRYFLLAI